MAILQIILLQPLSAFQIFCDVSLKNDNTFRVNYYFSHFDYTLCLLTVWKSHDPYLRPLHNYLSNFFISLFPCMFFSFLKVLECSIAMVTASVVVTLLGLSPKSLQDNQLMLYLCVTSFLKVLLCLFFFNKVLINLTNFSFH